MNKTVKNIFKNNKKQQLISIKENNVMFENKDHIIKLKKKLKKKRKKNSKRNKKNYKKTYTKTFYSTSTKNTLNK